MSNASEPLAWARRLAGLGLITALGLSLVACGGDDDEDEATDSGDSTEEPADSGSDSGDDPYGDDDAGGNPDNTGDDTGAGDAAGGEYQITAIEYTDATAGAGSQLTIADSSGTAHTFTADDGAFDVPVPGDDTATLDVPAEPGDFPFHCEIHPSMQATLTVE